MELKFSRIEKAVGLFMTVVVLLVLVTVVLIVPAGMEGPGRLAALGSSSIIGALIITGVLATGLAFFVQCGLSKGHIGIIGFT